MMHLNLTIANFAGSNITGNMGICGLLDRYEFYAAMEESFSRRVLYIGILCPHYLRSCLDGWERMPVLNVL